MVCITVICACLGSFALAAGPSFVTQPTVFISGEEEYNIVWVTDDSSAAFVELSANGVTYVFRDERDGVIRTDDWIHTVRVPKSVLDAAKGYTVISRTVFTNDVSGVTFDSESRADYAFTPYSGEGDITFGFFSDLHLRPAEFTRLDHAKTILDNYIGGADVIVLNGDITDAMPTENYFTDTLLEACHRLSGGTLPVVYVRGNHEARGEYAQYLKRYLAFDTGEMYGSFSYGGVSAIVADCGEDKADYRDEYGGMVDFDNYLARQLTWLENMGGYREGAAFRLGISHSPNVLDRMKTPAIAQMQQYGTDILVAGHYHTAQSYSYASYDTVTDGGLLSDGYRAGGMTFRDGMIEFNVYDQNGENLFSHTLETDVEITPPQSSIITAGGVSLDPLVSTARGGVSGAALVGSTDTATVSVAPTVFDCGDTYSIVYMTDAGSGMSKATAVVEKDGESYTFTDSVMGNAVSSLLHSISVPKSILEGATYQIKTTHLGSYGAYGEKISYDGVYTDIGLTVTSEKYEFPDFSGKDNICIASFSDMKGGITDAVRIKNSLTVDPDVIVIGGSMTDGLYTREDFVKSILVFAQAVSGGEVPVILCRGEGEAYGDFAPYLSEFLRVSRGGESDGLYFATSYGELNLIVCDTAGAYLSNDYYLEQSAWLSRLTLPKGSHSFVLASNAAKATELLGASYGELGVAGIIGKSTEYGTVTVYDAGSYGQKENSFAGTGDIAKQPIAVAVSDSRAGERETAVPQYKTNSVREQEIVADTENEAVKEKPTDLAWWTLTVYEWTDRGIDITLPAGEITAMNCARALVAYANASGVDFDRLNGTNRQSKAIAWAYGAGIINYSPPILHEFTAEEVAALLEVK